MTNAYPQYRDSGVEWLGRIPEHWRVDHLNRSVVKSAGEVEGKQRLQYIGLEHVESWSGNLLPLDDQFAPEGSANSFTTGDILFGKLRPYLAKAFRADSDGLCSTEFLVLTPVAYHESYLLYLLLTPGFVQRVDSSTYGAKMPRANWGFIGDSLLPVPPIEEQRAIAAFLDRETTRVDELVAQQEQLLERLAEYRTALIANTVTRGLPAEAAMAAGLDPHPRYRDSGVEWLGHMPGHWDIRKLDHVLSGMVGGGTPDTENEVYWSDDEEDGIPWVAISDMSAVGQVVTTEKQVTPRGLASKRLKLLPSGTIIYSMYASVGAVARLGIPAVTNQAILGLFPGTSLLAEFLYWWLAAIREPVLALTRINTQSNLNAGIVRRFPIAVPPLEEQRTIGQFLDQETHKVDELMVRAELAVERLLEYRSALITHAVTGRIDVCGSVAHAGGGGG